MTVNVEKRFYLQNSLFEWLSCIDLKHVEAKLVSPKMTLAGERSGRINDQLSVINTNYHSAAREEKAAACLYFLKTVMILWWC